MLSITTTRLSPVVHPSAEEIVERLDAAGEWRRDEQTSGSSRAPEGARPRQASQLGCTALPRPRCRMSIPRV